MSNVLQHAKRVPGATLSNRILRGLVSIRSVPDAEDCLANWRALQEHNLDMDESAYDIVAYVRSWWVQFGQGDHPPDFDLAAEFFEKSENIEARSRLTEVANEGRAFIRVGYISLLRAAADHQEEKRVCLALNMATHIVQGGAHIPGPNGTKRLIRGVEAAREWLAGELSAASSSPRLKRRSLREMRELIKEEATYPRLPTGIKTVDEITGGGLPGDHVHIVVGAPGNLKSSWVTFLATTFARQGNPVLVMSLDEGPRRTTKRIVRAVGQEDLPIEFSPRSSSIEDEAAAVAATASRMTRDAGLAAIMADPRHLPRDENDEALIDHHVRRLGLRRTPVLVLDSIQKAGSSQKTAMERIDATVEAARAAAEKHGLLVIMTSEMNRQGYSSRNRDERSRGFASAKGSASIEYGAELVISFEKVTLDDGRRGVQVEVGKNREHDGAEPTFVMIYDGKSFHEADQDVFTPPPDDSERVLAVIAAGNGSIVSTRGLWDACAKAGLTTKGRIDQALAGLKATKRVVGGNGKPLIIADAPTVEGMIS